MQIMDGNEAVARVAYGVSEVHAIYPITPSSTMGEYADQWAAEGLTNVWGALPQVVEMQSEGGASGAWHGALQLGSLATTYTASQGLLLMIPNMFKIAGELIPTVVHVAARSLATHALSIFGDHSDVMAVRSTGFAMLASGSVQEAQDLALVAHAATLEARIPFLHFFEGFRVSHEVNKIDVLTNEQMKALIDDSLVLSHRQRALSPEHPCIRGTAQNPDVFFQGREAATPYYLNTPGIVAKYMDKFAALTGRQYHLMSYTGAADAERVIVIIGSGAKAVAQAVRKLQNSGEKVGVLQVYLFRPLSREHLLAALPKTVKAIAVLDRAKEPGSLGEPLYQDVVTALAEAQSEGCLTLTGGMPKVIGGRYGLSSKEFTPEMASAIFAELTQAQPKNRFTIGINDDVLHSSIAYDQVEHFDLAGVTSAVFYGLGSDGTVGANKNTIKIIGEETANYVQAYFVYDSKKSGSTTVSHLRFGPQQIEAPYLVSKANFIGCHQFNFIQTMDILQHAKMGTTLLLNSPYAADKVWAELPRPVQQILVDKKLAFYVIDAYKVANESGMGSHINTVMQTCFFAISGILPKDEAIAKIKEMIVKTYKRKGDAVVQKNFAVVDNTLANLQQVQVPVVVAESDVAFIPKPVVSAKAPEFVQQVLAKIMAGKGDELPVSALPADGTFPCGTTKWEKRNIAAVVPVWDEKLCIQCGQCTLICPHAVIRAKHFPESALKGAPASFITAKFRGKEYPEHQVRLQVSIEDCTGCGLCSKVCPIASKEIAGVKAVTMRPKEDVMDAELQNVEFFANIPYHEAQLGGMDFGTARGLQYAEPLFEFSGACAGCGETPYVKLVSQLVGDRLLVANATGCSSIYGGNLPTTPWTTNAQGCGPAWANSLFEDNAEFGYGFRLAIDQHHDNALTLLDRFSNQLDAKFITDIKAGAAERDDAGIAAQRNRVVTLKQKLAQINTPEARSLSSLADYLVQRSVWLMGGDGWAYDIGYGGLDHVLASNRKINVLVLDTGVYSNTGGQASKATPLGAVARFAFGGKTAMKKDLGLMMMAYGSVYVAQIALGSNPAQAIKAIREAEAYPGPSLIIAYSHCIAHGYNLQQGPEQQKLAVNSGIWPLYRYNPMRAHEGLPPLQLDSREPSVKVADYAYNESRFKVLLTGNPEKAKELMDALQAEVEQRWKMYVKMAAV